MDSRIALKHSIVCLYNCLQDGAFLNKSYTHELKIGVWILVGIRKFYAATEKAV